MISGDAMFYWKSCNKCDTVGPGKMKFQNCDSRQACDPVLAQL